MTTRLRRWRMQLLAVPAGAFLAISCASAPVPGPDPARAATVPLPESVLQQIERVPAETFVLLGAEKEGPATRINIRLKPPAPDAGEIKRLTLNALSAFRAAIGSDQWITVWSYADAGETVLGMAFYSSTTEKVVYKSAGEI